VTPASLERAAARHWRGVSESHLGDWLLRAASGFTGRANSALALGSPGLPLDDALAEVVAWYRARKLPAMIQLPADHPLDSYLAERRWAVRPGAAIVMTASPSSAPLSSAPLSSVPVSDVRFDPSPDDAWLARYNYRGSSIPPIAKTVLMSAPEQYFASIRDLSGAAIAIARLSLDAAGSPHADSPHAGSPDAGSPDAGSPDAGSPDGGSPDDGSAPRLAGITAVEVDPAYRRRGLGSAITRAVCTEAARRGADLVFLQTEVTNAPARALYEALGFHPSHTYHYHIAP
jgi:N-acetylglutamate synthase